jgi:hypothetical protein
MINAAEVPTWDRNDCRSAFAVNLGTIRMVPPNWYKWFNSCFQTCLWLGQSIPSKASQQKQHLKNTGWGNGN